MKKSLLKEITLREWLQQAAQDLKPQYENAYQEAVYLARAILGTVCDLDITLPHIAQFCLNRALYLRSRNIPLAKITGKKHFYQDWFLTNFDTLDPRPETECLIDSVAVKARTILELGVGTGCVLLSILKQFPKAKGVGVDISEKALSVAKENAVLLGLDKRVQFLCNNWADDLSGHYDVIVSNPPYICSAFASAVNAEAMYDPDLAIFGDESIYDALFKSLQCTFFQLILEVPENLLPKIEDLSVQYFPDYNFAANRIYDTQIWAVNIINNKTPQKVFKVE